MSYEAGPLATLPGFSEQDYNPAVLDRSDWYCIFLSMYQTDRDLSERRHCDENTRIHHDLVHVRRLMRYEFKAQRLQPFTKYYIYKLVLLEGATLAIRPDRQRRWERRYWRAASRVYPITCIEELELSRGQNLEIIERQIIAGGEARRRRT